MGDQWGRGVGGGGGGGEGGNKNARFVFRLASVILRL